MSTYLIFVRHFNDIDHITPLVDYLCRNKKRVYLATYNQNLRFIKNENLDYLKREHGIEPRFFFHDVKMPWHQHAFIFILLHILLKVTRGRPNILSTYTTALLQRSYARDIAWADRRLVEIKPSVIIFDWMIPEIEPVTSIIKSAKKHHIPVVSVPHGLVVYASAEDYRLDHQEVSKEERLERMGNLREQGFWFNYSISQGPVCSMHLLAQGYEKEELVEIGSMRYSREWIARYPEIISKKLSAREENKDPHSINVVIFFSKMKYNGVPEEIRDMVEKLAQHKNVQIILKPHTRGMLLSFMKDLISRYHIQVADTVSSFELSQWCDIAIVWGSSIGIQVLHDKKMVIDPLFADTNESIYEKYRAACLPKTVDELMALIDEYQDTRALACHKEENAQNFLRDIVYAGKLERNVIKDCVDFLESIDKKY